MMEAHRYSNKIKSIRLQTSLYDSVTQHNPSRRHVWFIRQSGSEQYYTSIAVALILSPRYFEDQFFWYPIIFCIT